MLGQVTAVAFLNSDIAKDDFSKAYLFIPATTQGRIYWRRDRRSMAHPLQFSNQKMSSSFSFKHQERHCFLWVLRYKTEEKFHNFYLVCYYFCTISAGFSFFPTT